MNTSEQINEVATALAKAQGMITGALKDSTNPHFKSSYADLASIWDACRSALSSNGLAVVQMTDKSDKDEVIVVTRIMHSSGQWIEGTLALPVSKADAQGYGSALTYARRYGLAAAVGIAQVDDDGNLAAQARPIKQPARPAFVNGEAHTARGVAVDAFANLTPETQQWLRDQAIEIMAVFERKEDLHTYIEKQNYDTEEKLALWSILPSECRTAIKKSQTAARETVKAA